MLHPGELFARTNECWSALAPPKDYWTHQIAAKAKIGAQGKAVIAILFKRMLSEHARKKRLIPDFEKARDGGEAMYIDYLEQKLWYDLADKYSRLLDCETPSRRRRRRPRHGANVIRGPWAPIE